MKSLTFAEIRTMVADIRKKAGSPRIRLFGWNSVTAMWPKLKKDDYGCHLFKDIIAINPKQSKRAAMNTIWHEIGHVLYPKKPHKWINDYAEKMSGFNYQGRKP